MLNDLQEKYFDEVRAMLPLHRICLFALGFIATLVSQQQTHKSIVESLLRLNLKNFSFEPGNFLENAQILHVLLGITLIFLGWAVSKIITSFFFKFLLRKTRGVEKIHIENKKIKLLLASSRKAAIEQLPYFEKQSIIASQKVIRAANLGELFMGIFICFMSAIWFGNALDLTVALIFLMFSLISIYLAIYLFFSKYVKFDLLRSAIAGTPSELNLPSE